ncbi:uncharacterized protein LOC113343653 [Papaver somniferum]|uniref:uncharacterized protein LOC113343653 n=1 Tax=Papaver somniferum TaxID=3469 RepID=UPI000E700ED2|nr:uncharacterized protein LOC113343653 [Papaver somniferum]
MESMEARKWKLRAKENGFRWGMITLATFHRICSARKQRNTIAKLQISGMDFFGQNVIKEEIRNYYINLFSAHNSSTISLDHLQFSKVDDDIRVWKERSFTEDEFWGLSRKWVAINHLDLMDSLYSFIRAAGVLSMDWRLNNSFITLIPTKEDSYTPKDFRPLSLISSTYKIISKILVEILKVVMQIFISDYQGAFIKEKKILDGILISNEHVDSRITSKKPGVICKIYMEKDLDNVYSSALFNILYIHGSGDR